MEMGLGINTRGKIFTYMIINLRLNLGDGSLYGNANINNESSFEGMDGRDTLVELTRDIPLNMKIK
jgi:hypothetical protein